MLTQRETFDVSYGGGKKTKTCVLPPVFFFGKNKISSLAYPCDPSAKPTRLASSVASPSCARSKKLQELLFCFRRSSFFSPVALEGWRGVRMWVWKRKKRGRRGGEGVSQPSLENLAGGQPGGAGAKLKVVSLLVNSPLTALLCSIAPAQTNHSCTAVRVTLK